MERHFLKVGSQFEVCSFKLSLAVLHNLGVLIVYQEALGIARPSDSISLQRN